jgi:hypothetical protein
VALRLLFSESARKQLATDTVAHFESWLRAEVEQSERTAFTKLGDVDLPLLTHSNGIDARGNVHGGIKCTPGSVNAATFMATLIGTVSHQISVSLYWRRSRVQEHHSYNDLLFLATFALQRAKLLGRMPPDEVWTTLRACMLTYLSQVSVGFPSPQSQIRDGVTCLRSSVANLQNMNRQANYAHYLMGLLGSNSLLV